jgi:hypothetical protein
MSSFRQIEANRRNAQLSTGPVTEEGKSKSRQNAVRHGLTAETVICALEDAEDYAAFEMAVTTDYDAQSAVERELVLRLASVLWRLRRATGIESGLFNIEAKRLLEFREPRQAYGGRQKTFDGLNENRQKENEITSGSSASAMGRDSQADVLTSSFIALTNLPSYPLDRLSRYEGSLWRQACQIMFTLQLCSSNRMPWTKLRLR